MAKAGAVERKPLDGPRRRQKNRGIIERVERLNQACGDKNCGGQRRQPRISLNLQTTLIVRNSERATVREVGSHAGIARWECKATTKGRISEGGVLRQGRAKERNVAAMGSQTLQQCGATVTKPRTQDSALMVSSAEERDERLREPSKECGGMAGERSSECTAAPRRPLNLSWEDDNSAQRSSATDKTLRKRQVGASECGGANGEDGNCVRECPQSILKETSFHP